MTIATETGRNAVATAYGVEGPYLGLLSALTLQAAVASGGTSVKTDLSVAVGDELVFDYGLGTAETAIVTAVSGSGNPYTVTVAALTYAHASGSYVSHIPLATIHELSGGSYARAAAAWGTAASSAVTSNVASAVSIPSGVVIGSVSVHTASSAGTYVDANPIKPQAFSSAGTWLPTYTQTFS